MSAARRFELIDVYEPGGADIAEHPEGGWVSYGDYKTLEARLDRGAAIISAALRRQSAQIDTQKAAAWMAECEREGDTECAT